MSSNETSELSEFQIARAMEIFSLYDANGSDRVHVDILPDLIRSLGLFPAEAQVKEIGQDLHLIEDQHIDFAEFLIVYSKLLNPDLNEEQELVNAFRVFDKNREGVINSEELLHHLSRMGEKFTDDQIMQIASLFEKHSDSQSMIDYRQLSKVIIRTSRVDL